MPRGGAPARADALATLGGVVHERFTGDEMGRLLDHVRPLEETLDYDSDDASPDPRHAARLGEAATRAEGACGVVAPRGSEGPRGLARGARGVPLRPLPPRLPARARGGAALGGAHGAGRVAVRRVPRRVRARDEDVRGSGGLRCAPARADRDRRGRRRAGRRLVPRRRLPGRRAAGVPRGRSAQLRLRGGDLAPRSHGAPVRGADRPRRHPHDDALPGRRPARRLGGDARGRPRPHRTRAWIPRSTAHRSRRTPSYGLGESQSRTWENLVGRSLPFWRGFLPRLQRHFPQLDSVDLDTWYRGINRVEPGLIRVNADEVTYSLHIILRFELEQELVDGTLAPEDLPEAWNTG